MLELRQRLLKDNILMLLRNHNHAVTVTENDVSRVHLDAAAMYRHIQLCQTLLHCTGGIVGADKYRESQLPDILCVTAAAVNHHTGKAVPLTCGCHNISEMTGIGITVHIQDQYISRLRCIDGLMQCQIVAGIALCREGSAYHLHFGIHRLDGGVHNALIRGIIVVVCDISCRQLDQLLLPFFCKIHIRYLPIAASVTLP